MEELEQIYKVSQMYYHRTPIAKRAYTDPVQVHFSILSLLRNHQNFYSLILEPNIPYCRNLLPGLNNLRLFSFHLVSNRRLGYDG